ncbi:hypothetical protein [Streptomyces sp. IBSBF 2390]|uniref:hypothetical protein n=1 Tax=Streptomyces sp. IBSBF 2390 TaxID=2903533 RepID=UPI003FA7D645
MGRSARRPGRRLLGRRGRGGQRWRGRKLVRLLILHTCAEHERERARAEGAPTPRAGWSEVATGLADAIVGLWPAPVSATR